MQPSVSWVLFVYRSPSETSTLRVRAWRILRRIGALSLQQSVYIVPNIPEATRKLRQLRGLIEESQGEVMWLEVEQFAGESTERLVQLFNLARSEEYKEFIEACSNLRENPLFAEGLESELKRLKKWLRKMRARDYFECPLQEDATRSLYEVDEKFTN